MKNQTSKMKKAIDDVLKASGAARDTPNLPRKPRLTGEYKAVLCHANRRLPNGELDKAIPKSYGPWEGADTGLLQWCAGFVDGEAYIGALWSRYPEISGRRPSPVLQVSINQNCLKTLIEFHARMGVHGRINPVKKQSYFKRPVFVLAYQGIHALAVMKRLRDYLVRKQAEVDVCLQLWDEGKLGRRMGPDGHSYDTWEARTRLIQKLKDMK